MGAESKLSAEAAARFVLGLSQGCSKEEVKRAFKRLALVFHPDKNKGQNEEEGHQLVEPPQNLPSPWQSLGNVSTSS